MFRDQILCLIGVQILQIGLRYFAGTTLVHDLINHSNCRLRQNTDRWHHDFHFIRAKFTDRQQGFVFPCQQYVTDAALYEGAFSFMEPHVPAFEKLGAVAMRAGSRLPGNTPNNLYPTADDQYIHITAASDAVFRRVTQAIGQPALASDERFATALARVKNEDAIDDIITRWTMQHSCAEAEALMHAAEVPATRIYTIADIFADPHYAARGMIASVPDDDLGSVTMPDVVPKLSTTPGEIRHSGHRIGQDTRTVLRELAGLTDDEINALASEKVIHCESPSSNNA